MFFVSCWFVFLIILVSLSQFTERKNLNGKLNNFPNPLFFFSRLCSAGNPYNYWTVLFSYSSIPLFIGFAHFFTPTKTLSQHVQMHLFFSIIPFLRTFLYNQNLHLCASCSHTFFIQLLYYSWSYPINLFFPYNLALFKQYLTDACSVHTNIVHVHTYIYMHILYLCSKYTV